MALLSHYYQPDTPAGIDELAMAQWIAALGDLPRQAIEYATMEWIRNERKRPTPADIRGRAQARIEPRTPPPPDDDEWPFAPRTAIPPEEMERRRVTAERIIKEVAAKKDAREAPIQCRMDDPKPLNDGVHQHLSGNWCVVIGGKIVSLVSSHREAWREWDKRTGEVKSRAEDTSEWISRR